MIVPADRSFAAVAWISALSQTGVDVLVPVTARVGALPARSDIEPISTAPPS